ncbi:MAG: DUF3789 domain-containing protein [Ruminococcus sp.]|nr:DUF3789 domain-containing protein [Ruminococcus sp.]
MISFIVGSVVGGTIGAFAMCMCAASKLSEKE